VRVGLVRVLSYDTKDSADTDLALAETTLGLADDLFKAELAAADTIDFKAAGLLAADVAALTIVVTFHDSLASWWWIPAIFLAFSSICFFLVLWAREWELGTEPRAFWNRHRHSSRLDILQSALANMERNRSHNEPFLKSKASWFFRGYWTLAIGIVTLLGTLWNLRHS
jgi:hypothetical protein